MADADVIPWGFGRKLGFNNVVAWMNTLDTDGSRGAGNRLHHGWLRQVSLADSDKRGWCMDNLLTKTVQDLCDDKRLTDLGAPIRVSIGDNRAQPGLPIRHFNTGLDPMIWVQVHNHPCLIKLQTTVGSNRAWM
jgi:hypothetical protein